MEASFKQENTTDKTERYNVFLKQLSSLIENETHEVSVLANVSAALKEAFGFFWIGFYLVEGDTLILGPFQGSVACYSIRKGKGVCGTAWSKKETLVVPNVNEFPGHIACSSLSRSEIVVPIFSKNEVKGVLDIDSDMLAAFDEIDKKYLEQVAELLGKQLYG